MASIIGVNELQHANGTTAATIDSSGRVLQPNLIAFHVYKNDGGAMSPVDPVVFNAVTTNVGSHYSTSTGKFTAAVSGVYRFESRGHRETTDNDSARIRIFKNGSTKLSEGYSMNSGGRNQVFTSVIVTLAANDYITVATADDNFWAGGDEGIHFQGQFLG